VFVASLAVCAAGAEPDPTPVATSAPAPKKITDVTLGFGYHAQTRWTGSLTVMRAKPTMLVALAPGLLAQARVGPGGVQGSAGLVFGVFEENPVKPSGLAATLKATVLRTFNSPRRAAPDRTYVGAEADVVILGVRGTIGYLRRVNGARSDPTEPGSRFLWGIGLGL
jgi:hypothetical protein